jgi:hypothetical protein
MNTLKGTVKVILDEQVFASGFNKREFVVTDEDDKYPQDIKFECVKDKVELVNKLKVGDKVEVTFDLRGNEYNDKYYVSLSAWKIEGGSVGSQVPATAADEVLAEEPPF